MSKRNFKRCLEADKKVAILNFTVLSSPLNKNSNCEYFDVSHNHDSTNVCFPIPTQITQTITVPSLVDINCSYKLSTCSTDSPTQLASAEIKAESKTLQDKLWQLICDYHISHNCVYKLLEILRSEVLDLPKDVRTLFQTPKSHSIIR